ncbi:MAG: hypothetical protein C0467_20425 [Planctomycetaceae bacterium]|nr:hypothetical protein [Planctomycetaceae bacterium]
MTRISLLLAICLIAAFGETNTVAQQATAQPAKLTPEQQEKLKARPKLWKEAYKSEAAGYWADARTAVAKCLTIEREVFGDFHNDVAESLVWLTTLSLRIGDYTSARDYGERALTTRKRVNGDTHWKTTDARISLSNVELLANMTKEQKAELVAADQLMQEGRRLFDRGEYERAEPKYREVIKKRQSVVGTKHPVYAVSLNNLAVLYTTQGSLAKAEQLLKMSLEIDRNIYGEMHPSYALGLNNLAVLYDDQGLFSRAEPLFKESLMIKKATLGERHPDYAISLNNLAFLYEAQGQFSKAEPLYTQALQIYAARYGERHSSYATSLNNLAALHKAQGQLVKAEPLFQKALDIQKEVLGTHHPEYATSLDNLAGVYKSQNALDKAEQLFQEALDIRKQILGETHPTYATSLNNLAALRVAQRRYTTAAPLFQEAIRIIEEHLERSAVVRSESGQFAFIELTRFYLNNLLNLPRTNAADVYATAFRWRGAVTVRQTFARATRGTDPTSRQTLDALSDVTRKLSNLVSNPPKPGPGIDVPKQLKQLVDEREALEEKLASQSKDFAKYRESRALKVTDIQKLLPTDAVLIDFLAFDGSIAAFIIKSKSIARVDLKASSSEIAEMVKDFRSETSLKRTRPVQGEGDKSVLREAVWDPLVPHLEGVNLVLICPDGPLCQLPFAALRGIDPKKYLIEELAIAVIPVPRLLPELLSNRSVGNPSLLLVGDVDFSAPPGEARAQGEYPVTQPKPTSGLVAWKPLDATAGEIHKIGDLFSKNVPGSVFKSLSKGEATEGAIRQAAGKHRYLHFATHGFFDDLKSAGQPDARSDGVIGNRVRHVGPNPGLLCGLVCAGANKPTPDDDGVLTALEISDLDLSGVELAVLSACETGLGKVAGGDGVLGLQRAFQLAGTRTTVTSLWQVPDEATSALMVRFYENRLKQGMPVLKALRESQLWVLNEGVKAGVLKEPPKNGRRTPPLYWAAFVLAGDWR